MLETLAYLASQDLSPILPLIQTPTLILVAENSVANDPSRTDQEAEMGFFDKRNIDKLRGKMTDAVDKHGDKISDGIDKEELALSIRALPRRW